MDIVITDKNLKDTPVGSKAQRLFVMRENGFNVPDFFCICAPCASRRELDEAQADFPEWVKACPSFAVRSSATCEDGSDFSFAGQFDTYLNVSREEAYDKILKCFASAGNDSALRYCAANGMSPDGIKMSVIVQKMIPAQRSGVMFSANPQGILNETVIVLGSGTGDGVVNGSVPVTTYYFNRTDEKYYYEREDGAPLLDKSELSELVECCKGLEALFGAMIDVEFAFCDGRLYILQSRPITSLSAENPLVFDNSNIVESYPGVTLPLSISFAEEAYCGVFCGLAGRVLKSKKIIADCEASLHNMIGSANGRIYYKISNWYRVIRYLPMSGKIIPVWQDMMGVSDKSCAEKSNGLNPFRRISTYASAVHEAFCVQKNMKKLNDGFSSISEIFLSDYRPDADMETIKKLYSKISDTVLKNWDVTLLNDMYAFLFTGLLKKSLSKKGGDVNSFISGISNIESMKPIRAMLGLAVVSEKHTEQLRAIDSRSGLESFLSTDSDFVGSFNNYISLYGDRAPEELKLETVTFRTDPLTLVKKLLDYTADSEKLHDMVRALAEKEPAQPVKTTGMTAFYAKKAAKGIKNREISRLNRTRIYGMVRTMFRRCGEIFFAQGKIDSPDDIFWLKKDEIFGGSQDDFRKLINSRKLDYAVFYRLPAFSRLIFSGGSFDKRHRSVNSDMITESCALHGTPCSDGTAQAQAAVVDDICNPPDVRGKIIVAKMTDPGWVFLLTGAAGIISEKGSLLSHTAIISRELGIPAVVGVKNAATIIKNGDVVFLDGKNGTVEIKEAKKECLR